ncbi:MAG: lamin tail domain-containing protein [Tidjanibacter sp.]|nr:lamin tail domain-containing protein [Tidjanibacter sp.]
MKKFFAFAAMAAVALTSCDGNEINVDGPNNGGGETKVSGIVLNELSGADKFIELYNTTDEEVSLEGVYMVKYDSSKEGGQSTTWTGKAGMKIAAKGFVVLESSDLADEAEGGDPNYVYESENHVFKGGLSGKKNVFIELYNAKDEKLSEFKRGDEGAGWNQVSGYNNDKQHTFSRVPDGTGEWAYADPTKGAANGAKVADIEQQPEM